MIVDDSLDEVKKRENALSIIKDIVENNGREFLFAKPFGNLCWSSYF